MSSHHPRRARTVLALLLTMLVALPPALAVAASSPGPTAHAAKRCARGKRCRRAHRRSAPSGGVPRPFNPLFSADRSLRVLVLIEHVGRTPRTTQVVDVRAGNVVVHCPTSGELRSLFVVEVPLRGSSFSGTQTDASGGSKRVDGRFTSATKAVGTYQVSFPDQRGGGTCDSGKVPFTATG